MTARLSAFFVWAALAASVVFWGLRLSGASPLAPAHTVPVGAVTLPHVDWTRLFGAEPPPPSAEAPPPELSSRFHLVGVVAPRVAGDPGIALLSVDNKPARAYRVGAVVDGDLVLQSVEARAASLGARDGPVQARLELPPLAPPATGVLPGAVSALSPGGPAPSATPAPTTSPTPPPAAATNVAPTNAFSAPPPPFAHGGGFQRRPMPPSPVPPDQSGNAVPAPQPGQVPVNTPPSN